MAAQSAKPMAQPPCSTCGKPSTSTFKGVPLCPDCWRKAYREETGGQQQN
jgi:predicted amidophosphoribosyltransferase